MVEAANLWAGSEKKGGRSMYGSFSGIDGAHPGAVARTGSIGKKPQRENDMVKLRVYCRF